MMGSVRSTVSSQLRYLSLRYTTRFTTRYDVTRFLNKFNLNVNPHVQLHQEYRMDEATGVWFTCLDTPAIAPIVEQINKSSLSIGFSKPIIAEEVSFNCIEL